MFGSLFAVQNANTQNLYRSTPPGISASTVPCLPTSSSSLFRTGLLKDGTIHKQKLMRCSAPARDANAVEFIINHEDVSITLAQGNEIICFGRDIFSSICFQFSQG
ncbi:uncharacterized protein LOC143877477 isoform X3 [Tasmannia lanceolata]|uniref:uncharacterized protein LOC143877477 isoform X3 n=1 Tax=Tasmannia lanceolata TaxID=3420 RepID=UPI0040647776